MSNDFSIDQLSGIDLDSINVDTTEEEYDVANEHRYSRQLMLEGYENSAILHEKRIAIIGLGGLGGLCSLLLANAGVGNLTIADSDVVTLTNLHRQILYTEKGIFDEKAPYAAQLIKERNSNVNIRTMVCRITELNFDSFIKDADFVMDLTDDPASRQRISDLCLDRKIDLLSTAVSAYTALFSIYAYSQEDFVKKFGCYRCLTNGDYINTKVGITGPIAATAASLAAHEALEYLLGRTDLVGKLMRFDLKNMQITKLRLTPNPVCTSCRV